MKPIIKVALVAVLFSATLAAMAAGEPPKPLEITDRIAAEDGVVLVRLENGLTVIVKATRTSPVVCVKAYVRAGSLYEREWLGCGISHLAEHLVAKGAVHDMGDATAAEAKQTSGRIKEIGGQSNAYTSMAHTCYYISATAGKAADCVDLIADWLARPQIALQDFQREHGVVQRELEMGMSEPSRQVWYTHAANAFAGHPAALPIIGHQVPLSKLTYDDVLEYVKRMYVPQNMVLAVVGDIDTEAMLMRIRRAFAGFEAGRQPDLSLPEVNRLSGVRRATREHPGLKEIIQRMSFQTIPLLHEDLYALDVLSYVLTAGRSSRLVQIIEREKKLVTSISSGSWTPFWGQGLFSVSFRASAEKADQAEAAVLDELKKIAAEGVAARDLERAKRQKVADFVYSQQTAESQADTLASDYLTAGDVGFSRRYTAKIQAVTAEQVQVAAEKYFTFEQMAITRLVAAAKPAASQPTTAEQPKPQSETFFTLPNGLRVILHPTKAVGLVSMTFATPGGLLVEDKATNGLGSLMATLSSKGAAGRSAEEIAAFFDGAGGNIAGNCGSNTFYWQATVLDDSFETALEVFADVIQRPDFTGDELQKLRPILLARIDEVDEDWQSQSQKFFRSKFFTNSPYGLHVLGSRELVDSATTEQIALHHRRFVKAGSSVLAIFGNFDGDSASQQVRRLFAHLPQGSVSLSIPKPRVMKGPPELHLLQTKNKVAAITVAVPGMKADNFQDRFAMVVLDTIISGYHLPAGWLHEELRGKKLVYVVHAYNWAGLAPGAFVTYAACQPDKVDQVVEIIRRNLDRAAGYQTTQKEIDLAVNSILTAELLDNQSLASLSMSAALDELYGFGYDFRSRLEGYYRKVTPQEVARVGRKYLGQGYVVMIATPRPELIETSGTAAGRVD